MEWVDTHSHIYLPEFDEDREAVVQRALAQGVRTLLLPNVDDTTVEPMLRLCAQHPEMCYPMMALHPTSVTSDYEEAMNRVEQQLSTNTFVAIGECGMDLYWDKTFQRQQEEVLRQHLKWAKAYRLPVIIHCREAFGEIMHVVKQEQNGSLTGIFHCFSGDVQQAQQVIDEGFVLGIGGVVTYKKSLLGTVLEAVGARHIVMETDSPYLAPVPYRGKRNESAYLVYSAQKVAEILQMPLNELAAITTQNVSRLFHAISICKPS